MENRFGIFVFVGLLIGAVLGAGMGQGVGASSPASGSALYLASPSGGLPPPLIKNGAVERITRRIQNEHRPIHQIRCN